MGAGVFPVVELHVHHRIAIKSDLHFDHAVLGGHLQSIHGGVRFDDRLAILRGRVLHACLCALQHSVFPGESVHHPVPLRIVRGAVHVVLEEQVGLFRN